MLIVFDSLRSSASVQKKNKSEEITKKSTFLLFRSSSEKVLLPMWGPSIKTWVGKRQPSAWVSKTSNAQRILGKVANPIRFNWVSWLLTGKIKNNWQVTIEVLFQGVHMYLLINNFFWNFVWRPHFTLIVIKGGFISDFSSPLVQISQKMCQITILNIFSLVG